MSTDNDNTISTTVKETSQTEDNKEDSFMGDLLQEMASEAIVSMAKVVAKKYSAHRLDGKLRDDQDN